MQSPFSGSAVCRFPASPLPERGKLSPKFPNLVAQTTLIKYLPSRGAAVCEPRVCVCYVSIRA